jgi:uncharacterized damage-inducible protein DinB
VERPEGPLTGPERPMLQAFLDWHRATLLYKCAGLTGEQLAERTVPPSALSLLGLVRHMTKVERAWFRQRFAGEPVDNPFGGDQDADFERGDPARAAADYARLTEEFKLADAAVSNASLDDTFVHNGENMSLRLIYLHMIEEYARHLGHADLLRERTDGATGELPGRGAGPGLTFQIEPHPIQRMSWRFDGFHLLHFSTILHKFRRRAPTAATATPRPRPSPWAARTSAPS